MKAALSKNEINIFSFYRICTINSSFEKPGPVPIGFEIRFLRINMAFGFGYARSLNNLYYYNTELPTSINSVPYNYLLFNGYASITYTLKSFVFLRNVFSVGLGVDWNILTAANPSLDRIEPVQTSSSGSLKFIQMNDDNQFSGEIFISKYFWIRNQEMFIRIAGYIPISNKYAKVSDYATYLQSGYYNQKMVNIAELSLHIVLWPPLKYNPGKLTYL